MGYHVTADAVANASVLHWEDILLVSRGSFAPVFLHYQIFVHLNLKWD